MLYFSIAKKNTCSRKESQKYILMKTHACRIYIAGTQNVLETVTGTTGSGYKENTRFPVIYMNTFSYVPMTIVNAFNILPPSTS